MGKVLTLVPRDQPRTPAPTLTQTQELWFAPGLLFKDVVVPHGDLAEEIRAAAIAGGRMPESQAYAFGAETVLADGQGHDIRWTRIIFPMSQANFALYGWVLMEHFHGMCFGGGSVDEGNEFMLFYRDPHGDKEGKYPPAADMLAVLYASPDQGKNWYEASNFTIGERKQNQQG